MSQKSLPTVLLYCQHTVAHAVRSGIQRVVVELATALHGRCNLRPVKWDEAIGQLRDLDSRELGELFGPDLPAVTPHPFCHRVDFRFVDTVETPRDAWLLYPEISYFLDKGTQRFAAMRAQCREVGIRSAAIFYDLIPVLEDGYKAGRPSHLEYLVETLQCDRIFTISQFSADNLVEFVEASAELTSDQQTSLRKRVKAASLGECRQGEPWGLSTPADDLPNEPRMVMVGTIEPRKQQVRLLSAINDMRRRHPELNALHIDLFGSLHPDCAEQLHAEIRRNTRIHYHQYASDAAIEAAYSRSWFSAFVSRHEGFGLPIVESLRHGVPCLTASFGAMGEVAKEGGCLTVDVLDDGEMVKGVCKLLTDSDLIDDLKRQIAVRSMRSWEDYAGQILQEFEQLNQERRDAERQFELAAAKLMSKGSRASQEIILHGVEWTMTSAPANVAASIDRSTGHKAALLVVAKPPVASEISQLAQADVIACTDPAIKNHILSAANELALDELLPSRSFFGSLAMEQAITGAIELSRQRENAHALRDETEFRRRLLETFWAELPHPPAKLAVVMSTYNRGGFIEHNVEWLLGQIDARSLPVRCVVVDNASTDDTTARLARFVGHPNFTLIRNVNNVGMLGNLRVCAAGLFAPYVWLTGDDDFIISGRIESVLEAIDKTPGLPLMVHNFGVYHRASFSSTDHAAQFINELQMLVPDPRPTSVEPVNVIAGEHDNLYTAIYPLVFRSDVLAACFDYPFNGTPFGDLIECVPTTKLLLGSYRYCDAQWFAEIGIAGNAHNSWSSHRPRWHLVIIPLVLQLAREAGVEPERVWQWLHVHKSLFEEAVEISIAKNETSHLEVETDIPFAEWCFRTKFVLSENMKLAKPGIYQRWQAGFS
jgi:glycosyltransferase involved in cell wall biosynthesis